MATNGYGRTASFLSRVALSATLASSPAYAIDVFCPTKVKAVAVQSGGVVFVSFDGLGTMAKMCNVNVQYINGGYTIPPESCKASLSLWLTAQSTRQDIVLWFSGVAPGLTCSTLGTWTYWSDPPVYPSTTIFGAL